MYNANMQMNDITENNENRNIALCFPILFFDVLGMKSLSSGLFACNPLGCEIGMGFAQADICGIRFGWNPPPTKLSGGQGGQNL